ncbi:MAG TPA: aldo/keto reductase [Chthoniobacteraceae bacterium]|jgi:predicted oxidoreductase
MEKITLGSSPLEASRIAYGCWRIASSGETKTDLLTARNAVMAAVEAGITLFDLADIYCNGRSESAFGQVLHEQPALRKKVLIATKCGIRPSDSPGGSNRYDSSAEHIIRSCEGSLRRLGVDRIDLYQLHRPDWLMEVDEVAKAFQKLEKQGKVRDFGVSNFTPTQIELLGKVMMKDAELPIIVQQIEISLLQLDAFTDGRLDQCLLQNITPLAWSPLGSGLLGDGAVSLLPSQQGYEARAIIHELDAIAKERESTRSTIALAWLLRHPAKIIPIIGSTRPERIKAAALAAEIELTRDEWYRLLIAAKGGALA